MQKSKYYLGIEGELIRKDKNYPVRIAFIGCGSHSFRNIFPTFKFLPVELVAVCDLNKEKAKLYSRQFGGEKVYTDYKEMIEREELDAIFVVVGYSPEGNPKYLPIIKYILEKGIPVWFEKPPTKNAVEVEELQKSEQKGKSFAQVGFKKMFMPTVTKVKEIINSEEFGNITSYTLRYPVDLPKDIRDIKSSSGRRFLDDFVHVSSTVIGLLGCPDELSYRRTNKGSSIVTLLHEKKGFVGSIHLCPGASEMCPLETLEIVGENANIILYNNIEIKYYPPTKRIPYGTTPSFIPKNKNGASYFMPEFSLGQIYNKGLFLLGYYHEVKAFIDNVSQKTMPSIGGLKDTLKVMQLYDAFAGKEGELIDVRKNQRIKKELDNKENLKIPTCEACNIEMYMKDGWNFSCSRCGKMIASSELN
jgi:predicted dehydrogenase